VKYWSFLVAKLIGIGVVLYGLWMTLGALWQPEPVFIQRQLVKLNPFGTHLGYTAAMMGLWLLAVGLVYLAVLDQRYRCRACLRRLRMPVSSGEWDQILLGRPRTEYICLFGHGTLRVPELHLASPELIKWKPIDDMWKELNELEETRH
jgi:hypothetical protein